MRTVNAIDVTRGYPRSYHQPNQTALTPMAIVDATASFDFDVEEVLSLMMAETESEEELLFAEKVFVDCMVYRWKDEQR